ncbi:MAG: GvpL/GvpF family gas vesicle protein [Acidobacteriota bacterium]
MTTRYALIGAHLEQGDADTVEGVTLFTAGPVIISAAPFDDSKGLASRQTIDSVAMLRGRLLNCQTFVAIRYGASVSSGDEAMPKCRPFIDRWHELLVRHRGKVEMTMKAVAGEGSLRPDRREFISGAGYLRDLQRLRSERALPVAFESAVESAFSPLTEEIRHVDRQDLSREFAFLIPRDKLEDAFELARTLKEEFPSVPFLFSGPWPLEEFARLEAEGIAAGTGGC